MKFEVFELLLNFLADIAWPVSLLVIVILVAHYIKAGIRSVKDKTGD